MKTHKRDRLSYWEKNLFLLEKYLAFAFVFALGSTYRYRELTEVPEQPVIFAFWHRNLIPLLFRRKFEKITVLISSSKDGELIAGPSRAFGYKTIRGSSTRHGAKAARSFIRSHSSNVLAISPDGPKGPAEKIKEGLPTLAYLSKIPVSMVSVDVDKAIVFNSWDRFRLPLPFARINISYSKPMYIESKDEISNAIEKLELIMKEQDITNKIR